MEYLLYIFLEHWGFLYAQRGLVVVVVTIIGTLQCFEVLEVPYFLTVPSILLVRVMVTVY